MLQYFRSTFSKAIVPLVLVMGMMIPAVSSFAAVTPSLGAAQSYAVLASTLTNTTAGSLITGDIGFTTGPAVAPSGTHANYGSGIPYAQAGSDQATALSSLSSQPCTFNFPAGAVNLSTETTHGPVGIYTPGVYCSSGAMNIGGPLNLNGNGTFIFRANGALTSVVGSIISLNGASDCNVFWTPTQATTLAANTTFRGIVIDDAGITVGANTTWFGMALAFGGTVTVDTVSLSLCALPPPAIIVSSSSFSSSSFSSSFSSSSSSRSSSSSSSMSSSQQSLRSSSSSSSSMSSSFSSSVLSLSSSSSSSRPMILDPIIIPPVPPTMPTTGVDLEAFIIAALGLMMAVLFVSISRQGFPRG